MSQFLSLKNKSAPVLLLALLLVLATSFANAHIHSSDPIAPSAHLVHLDDCPLCHAGMAFTFDSGTPYEGSRVIDTHFEASRGCAIQLGYSYIPESRPPPHIS